MKVTGFRICALDNYGMPTGGIPHLTKVTVIIDKEEKITALFGLNPSVETFCKIARNFIDNVEKGLLNQRKEQCGQKK